MNKYAIGKNIKLFCIRQITVYGLYRVSKVLGVSMNKLSEGIEDE